jgi:hypothetical protein
MKKKFIFFLFLGAGGVKNGLPLLRGAQFYSSSLS